MSDSTPTRNKQLLSDEAEDMTESSSGEKHGDSSATKSGGIQNGIKHIASSIGGFSRLAVNGLAGLMGIPSKAVSIALAVLMGTSSLAVIGTSDTSTNSTAIRSESVTNLDYVDHPNEQEAYFDTLSSLEKVDAAHKIYNYFKSLGYTDESIAGILSNIEAESGLLSDYYTGKEVSLYTSDNKPDPNGLSGSKDGMYDSFYDRNWYEYTVALYNEYKSDDKYNARGLSNYTQYQVRNNNVALSDSCLAVDAGTDGSVQYLPGFGLFQFAGQRAKDYIYFANCQTVCNDYNNDNINDQWISAPLQIAYLYFENKECEPGVRVNKWGTTDYYGEYGQQIVVDINKTYETEPNNDNYKDPNNWKIAHCLNSMTSTGNVVYEYFTILIEEKQATTWKDNNACTLPYPGVQPATLLDGVTKHKSQEIEYTLTYKPMLYTFVIPKDKVGTVNRSNYNHDSAYLTEINNKLQTLTPKDAVAYMKSIGGTSFTEKDDFLKDKDGNDLDYSGEFKTTSYWKWEDEKVGDTFKNEAPDSLDLRRKYSDWQSAITDYNNSVNKLKEYYDGNKKLKEYVGQYEYILRLRKDVSNMLHRMSHRNPNNPDDKGYLDFLSDCLRDHTSPTYKTRFHFLHELVNYRATMQKHYDDGISGFDYGVSYNYTGKPFTHVNPDGWFGFASAKFTLQGGGWLTLDAGDWNSMYGGIWDQTFDDLANNYALNFSFYDKTPMYDLFMDMFIDSHLSTFDSNFVNRVVNMYNHIVSGNDDFLRTINDGKWEDLVLQYSNYTDAAYQQAYKDCQNAAQNLDSKYNALQTAYNNMYKPKYDKFMSDRNAHEIHDIDYIGSTINGRNLHVHTSDNQRCNGDDFYSNALVRKDPKRFQSIQRGFNTYWYRAGLIGTSSLAKDYPGRVQADPGRYDQQLRVDFSDGKHVDIWHLGKQHNEDSDFPYILDGFDMYYTYNHRYDIYWKGDDYSYSGSIASNTTTKTDEYGVSYKEFTPTGGKTNGYSGYLMSAAYKFDYLMDLAARPSNKYQDGEDMAFQNAIYFYTNYLGYDMTGIDPYTAVNSTSSDEKIKSFRAHCKRSRYWYRVLVNEKWSEKLDSESKKDYKNEVFSHLPKDSRGSRVVCDNTQTAKEVLYSDEIKKKFNVQYMSYWETDKADELYNYQGNVFDNSSLAATAVSLSYPYGYDCYAVDDTTTILTQSGSVAKDSDIGTAYDGLAPGYVGRRVTAMNAAVSFVVNALAQFTDDTDPLSIAYDAEEVYEKMCDLFNSGKYNKDDSVQFGQARSEVVSEVGESIVRLDSPTVALAIAVRASGRDDNFPALFDELCPYLGIAEEPDRGVLPWYDKRAYTTDISVIKERLTARNEEDFDESKWSLVDFIHKRKKTTTPDPDKKEAGGAGKWEVKGILTDGATRGDYISYKNLKPGDICVSYTDAFMFVGSEGNMKFIKYDGLTNSKYAVCYATSDKYSQAELLRKNGHALPSASDGTAYFESLKALTSDTNIMGNLSRYDGFNATGLVCRELADDGEDLYIKQLIREANADTSSSPYIVFRSINDDFELSRYYKVLNSCDFRAYQDGKETSDITYGSIVPLFYKISNEQGVSVTDKDSDRSISNKLTYLYGFNPDSPSTGNGKLQDIIKAALEKAKNRGK